MGHGTPVVERILVAAFRPLAILAAVYGFMPPPWAILHLLGRAGGPTDGPRSFE
ncbi:hypothetical protein CFP65_4133 [Kitasatospora sp. MMS16-BH015]|uniref:hypothetical protein n=1 Tax=Kitasatospora sp. MMS16-BH015 TaxID=2018025 RepID=UPI000CA3A035|nr:hypothetical protein [Kitasatospora sp. MMS16-BH015]AUG78888.1 hypothetical protein CFP65_4133 [Kitasatospora sp. MMS16-BH015]